MTRPTVTKAQLKRAIEAARESGLRVKGIAPDGTLLLDEERSENSWVCWHCNQRNAGWALQCGRCERGEERQIEKAG